MIAGMVGIGRLDPTGSKRAENEGTSTATEQESVTTSK
jgi:hypothetical protein